MKVINETDLLALLENKTEDIKATLSREDYERVFVSIKTSKLLGRRVIFNPTADLKSIAKFIKNIPETTTEVFSYFRENFAEDKYCSPSKNFSANIFGYNVEHDQYSWSNGATSILFSPKKVLVEGLEYSLYTAHPKNPMSSYKMSQKLKTYDVYSPERTGTPYKVFTSPTAFKNERDMQDDTCIAEVSLNVEKLLSQCYATVNDEHIAGVVTIALTDEQICDGDFIALATTNAMMPFAYFIRALYSEFINAKIYFDRAKKLYRIEAVADGFYAVMNLAIPVGDGHSTVVSQKVANISYPTAITQVNLGDVRYNLQKIEALMNEASPETLKALMGGAAYFGEVEVSLTGNMKRYEKRKPAEIVKRQSRPMFGN